MLIHKIFEHYVLYGTYRTIPGPFPIYYPTKRFCEFCTTFTPVSGSSLTLSPKRPLIPGFPVTPVSRCFIGTEKHTASLTRCVYIFG